MSAEIAVGDALFLPAATMCAAVCLWAFVDVCGRSEAAFRRSGHNKVRWLVLLASGVVVAVLGQAAGLAVAGVLGADYLVTVRSSVRAMAEVVPPPRDNEAPRPE
jgi:hypothetical protein